MTTSFTVFSLGQLAIWDTVEGNQTLSTNAVNAALGTYGSATDPLYDSRQEFAPAGTGFGGAGGDPTTYDLDNNLSNDQFSIDGGPAQTFDASMIFNAVITYNDGTTASITAVVFQDSNGNTYWAPEFAANADQTAIEAKPIQSIQLGTPIYADGVSTGYNLTADRQDSQPLCFTPGVHITCPHGDRPVEDLAVGDLIMTMDHGPQPIRWIGRRKFAALGRLAPIRINQGVLGATRAFEVSPQHRVLLCGPEAELMFAAPQVLGSAKHLVDGENISVRYGGEVDYIHLLLDRHEIIWANGVATETLLLGKSGEKSLDQDSLDEILTIFPALGSESAVAQKAARPILKAHETASCVRMMHRQIQAAETATARSRSA